MDLDAQLHNAATLFEQRNLVEAETLYREILDTDRSQPVALCMLGVIAYAAGAAEEAIDFIKMAIYEAPNYADAYSNLGRVYRSVDRHEEALAVLAHAAQLNSQNPETYYNIGASLYMLDRSDEAIEYVDLTLSFVPYHIDALNLKGNILVELSRSEDALEIYEQAINLNPQRGKLYADMAAAQTQLGLYAQALESFDTAQLLSFNDPSMLTNLAILFRMLGRFDDACIILQEALAIAPDDAQAHINLGYTYLATGRTVEGMEELENRWSDPKLSSAISQFETPQWDGVSDLGDKSILVWPEQGLQNVINWSSAFSHLAAKSDQCVIETDPRLMALFSRSFPMVEIREAQPDATDPETTGRGSDVDYHLPVGSLFLHQGTDLEAKCDAFLVPAPEQTEQWQKRLAAIGPGPYIGIRWKTSDQDENWTENCTKMNDWKSVLEKDAVFICMQPGDCQEDIELAQQEFGVDIHTFDEIDLTNDLDNMAALSSALDLVISVPTTVSAISAGVGTEVWLLSWKESSLNNILYAPRGPNVVNIERTVVKTWEEALVEVASKLDEKLPN